MLFRRSKGYSYDNTRRYVRLPAAWPIKYEAAEEGSAEVAGKQVSHTADVSAGGVSLNIREMLPVGSRIKLEIHVPPLGRSVQAVGSVIRCAAAKKGGYDIGIRFEQIEKADQIVLDGAIQRFYSPRQRDKHRSGAWWRSLP